MEPSPRAKQMLGTGDGFDAPGYDAKGGKGAIAEEKPHVNGGPNARSSCEDETYSAGDSDENSQNDQNSSNTQEKSPPERRWSWRDRAASSKPSPDPSSTNSDGNGSEGDGEKSSNNSVFDSKQGDSSMGSNRSGKSSNCSDCPSGSGSDNGKSGRKKRWSDDDCNDSNASNEQIRDNSPKGVNDSSSDTSNSNLDFNSFNSNSDSQSTDRFGSNTDHSSKGTQSRFGSNAGSHRTNTQSAGSMCSSIDSINDNNSNDSNGSNGNESSEPSGYHQPDRKRMRPRPANNSFDDGGSDSSPANSYNHGCPPQGLMMDRSGNPRSQRGDLMDYSRVPPYMVQRPFAMYPMHGPDGMYGGLPGGRMGMGYMNAMDPLGSYVLMAHAGAMHNMTPHMDPSVPMPPGFGGVGPNDMGWQHANQAAYTRWFPHVMLQPERFPHVMPQPEMWSGPQDPHNPHLRPKRGNGYNARAKHGQNGNDTGSGNGSSTRGRVCVYPKCTEAVVRNSLLCQAHVSLEDASDSLVPIKAPSEATKASKCGKAPLGNRCHHPGCLTSRRRPTLFCVAHGGGKRCQHPLCNKSAVSSTKFCVSHGGGRRCTHPGCSKSALSTYDLCRAHGAGEKCAHPGCNKWTKGTAFEYCTTHWDADAREASTKNKRAKSGRARPSNKSAPAAKTTDVSA